ncbi:MAG: ADP-forming succinate--CoA ligase subunit beta [Gammaproteobacteria bacterium]|nr:MAG: ADP-forming succinate--CoA ligase subunit beta [Gammaproteobacteria bacterium]
MNLQEYQSRNLFEAYDIPVPAGAVASSSPEAREIAQQLGGSGWVVKAQVHAGGRGKAGGVKLVKSLDELTRVVDEMLGMRIRTPQTGAEGLPVNQVLVAELTEIGSELYLSALVDRASCSITFMASAAGGVDIEEVAATEPEKIFTVSVHPAAGLQPWQCRKVGFGLGLDGQQIRQLTAMMQQLYRLIVEKDLSLVEVNPLAITGAGNLIALDAKVNVDDNALFRHPDLAAMRDESQEDERELEASRHGLNYVTLDGNIACMVNGAGLAMATMDIIKLHGGVPANFLDVGGGATAQRVTEAFKLILSDDKVKSILVNIFGGIVRCDVIAKGIIAAMKEVECNVPVVVRLEGTNVEKGRKLLEESGFALTIASDLTDAATRVVAAAA